MKIIIIDDEKMAIEVLEYYLSEIEDIKVIASYTDPRKFLEEQVALDFDVVFVDVEMPEMLGIEVVRKLKAVRENVVSIFVTAYRQYAFEAYQVDGFDYLAKPVTRDRLNKTIDKARQYINNANAQVEQQIYFKLLGNIMTYIDDKQLMIRWRTKKVQELLIYLIHHYPVAIERDKILMDLWPDKEDRSSLGDLHTTVYRLRSICTESFGDELVQVVSGRYGLRRKVLTDIERVEAILSFEQISDVAIRNLMQYYQGGYLEIEAYEWASKKRLELHKRILQYLERYICMAIGNLSFDQQLLELAIETALEIDPYNEAFLKFQLDFYKLSNDKNMIIKSYKDFEKRLHIELSIEISDKLKKIYNRMLQDI